MPMPRSAARLAAAFIAATAIAALTAATALAHPESEGDHPGGCIVTAEPGTIPVGGEFTVEGTSAAPRSSCCQVPMPTRLRRGARRDHARG